MKASTQREKYLFDIDNYKIIKEINRGGFGVINLVRDTKTKEEYAAKTNLIQTKQNKLFLSREINILIQVQHPTMVKFLGFSYVDFDKKKNVTILMEYMKEGSLASLIAKEQKSLCPREYDNTKRQIILIGTARAMMLLHKLHIIHRDLKPENILIDDNFHPHITDFGLSKFFDPNHTMTQSMADTGTAAYMAPEVITGDRFNTKADVYAFGILMYEVLTGNRAYSDILKGKKKLNMFTFKEKVKGGLRPKIEEGTMKKSLQFMIEKCWSEDPKERPTFSELYKKLSLIPDDFLDLGASLEQSVINYEDDEDNDEEEDEQGINKTFCLESVDYEEVLDYVDEISVEPRSATQQRSATEDKDIEIDQLKKEVEELKSKTAEMESKLSKSKQKTKNLTKLIDLQNGLITNLTSQLNEINMPRICRRYIIKSDMKGIISHLYEKVTLSAGGKSDANSQIENLKDNDNKYFYNYSNSYKPMSENDSFIEFDFGESVKVDLFSYLIRSNNSAPAAWYHPKSWRIEGSNDKENWTELDKRIGNSSLNGSLYQSHFVCQQACNGSINYRFRYIRYVQEDSWRSGNPYNVYLTYFELYGDIYDYN